MSHSTWNRSFQRSSSHQSLSVVLKKLNLTQKANTRTKAKTENHTKPEPKLMFKNCSCVCVCVRVTVYNCHTTQNGSDNLTSCPPITNAQICLLEKRGCLSARQWAGTLGTQHSHTAEAWNSQLLFFWGMSFALKSPELKSIDYKMQGVISSMSMNRTSPRLKKSSSDWFKYGKSVMTAFKGKMLIPFKCFARKCRSISKVRWETKSAFDCLIL